MQSFLLFYGFIVSAYFGGMLIIRIWYSVKIFFQRKKMLKDTADLLVNLKEDAAADKIIKDHK